MAEQRGSKGLSRADVLVAAVVCLLLIALVPVLFARPREQSVRKLCAANLAQIGKAMFVYAGDYEDEFPRVGGPGTGWGPVSNWAAADRRTAFGLAKDGSGGMASINSCFYLLVKRYDVPPRLFLCAGDKGSTEFKIRGPGLQLSDIWDFGPSGEAFKHCSYTYQIPFGLYAFTTSSGPNLAVAADRNPWIASPAADPSLWVNFMPDIAFPGGAMGNSATARSGNSITHQQDGQNVLFVDGRVSFEKRAFCAVENDNIYTRARPWSVAMCMACCLSSIRRSRRRGGRIPFSFMIRPPSTGQVR
jgi:hypothetical protein